MLFGDGGRPLLLPVAEQAVQARCLAYFIPGGVKALYARALLAANAALPRLRVLPEVRTESGLHGFLSRQVTPGRPVYIAARMGPAGPSPETTAVLVSAEGEGLVRGKIGLTPAADRKISEEAAWLRELEAARELENQIPRLLAEEAAPNGRRYLATTLAPDSTGSRDFTAAHLAFLSALGRVRRDVMSFASSPCGEAIESMLEGAGPYFKPAERSALHSALADCRLLLADWMGPFVAGHGDFAPWSIRVLHDRIFVSDWQHARSGTNPLADAIHFRVMPRAMSRRPPGPEFLVDVLRYARRAADLLYPEFTWRTRAISGLALAYLLDVLLRATPARSAAAPVRAAMAGYLRLIEHRATWIAT